VRNFSTFAPVSSPVELISCAFCRGGWAGRGTSKEESKGGDERIGGKDSSKLRGQADKVDNMRSCKEKNMQRKMEVS
jgi:hypothetical protein